MANTCISCQQEIQPPTRRGTFYTCTGETSGNTITFWMCNPCAIPLGPSQGPILKIDPNQKPRIPGGNN